MCMCAASGCVNASSALPSHLRHRHSLIYELPYVRTLTDIHITGLLLPFAIKLRIYFPRSAPCPYIEMCEDSFVVFHLPAGTVVYRALFCARICFWWLWKIAVAQTNCCSGKIVVFLWKDSFVEQIEVLKEQYKC